jgi:hypothetical protein
MFERLNDDQFKYMIEAMCLYKQLNPDKNVSLSEKSAKVAMNFFNREGNRYIPMLNAMTESGLSMEELIQQANDKQANDKQANDKATEENEVEEENTSIVEEEEEVDDDSD